MIEKITWKDILPIWQTHLWPYRSSPIESNSAMLWKSGYSMINMKSTVTFFGYIVDGKIVGVNSGHGCVSEDWTDQNYRSRGLWVDPKYRGQGIGQQLLSATVDRGIKEGNTHIWSYPRDSSWNTYKAVGFFLDTEWTDTENGKNAYCSLLKA